MPRRPNPRLWLFVAVTGTPGTGKSELARRLARRGALALEAADLARKADAMGRRDRRRATTVVDVARVDRWWRANREGLASRLASSRPTRPAGGADAVSRRGPLARVVLVVGHWSHDLAVDGILVLRASPRALRRRLAARGYPAAKVRENVEAEALDVILAESVAAARRRRISVAELATSGRAPAAVARDAGRIIRGEWGRFPPGRVDWSEEFLARGPSGDARSAGNAGLLARRPSASAQSEPAGEDARHAPRGAQSAGKAGLPRRGAERRRRGR